MKFSQPVLQNHSTKKPAISEKYSEHLMHPTELYIEMIRTDGGTQSRVELDLDLVNEYSRLMHNGVIFPPIDVCFDGKEYWLIDGFHRLQAAKYLEMTSIRVTLIQGSRRDAQLISFGVNADHGKRRTNADKRKAVMAMLADAEWSLFSDREIARICSVSNDFVSRQRKESHLSLNDRCYEAGERKVTRNGTTYTQKTANIGKRVEEQMPMSKDEIEILDALPNQVSAQNEEDTQPPETLEYTAEQAQADVQEKFAEEHELRMAELAHLMGEEGQLANALKEVERLSLEIAQRDEMISMYKMRLNGMTSEMNVLKKEVAKYKKAFVTFNRERKK